MNKVEFVNNRVGIMNMIFFMGIGLFIFSFINSVFTPNWVYGNANSSDYAGEIINGIYLEKTNSLDYVVFGTSHSLDAISPMEIYSDYGLKGYNMSTNAQSIELSYYLLKEIYKRQSPDIIVLDVSGLFFQEVDKAPMQIAFDSMACSKNKIDLANEMCKMFPEYYSTFFDIYGVFRYHDRWNSLTELDFNMRPFSQNYLKGYWICSNIKSGISVEEMNSVENIIMQNNEQSDSSIDNCNLDLDKQVGDFSISENNQKWLGKFKELCKNEGSTLVLIVVPSVQLPQREKQVWTKRKSLYMKKIASEVELDFYDFLYDYETGIDWNKDSTDGGYHLNIKGAEKISGILGIILTSRKYQKDIVKESNYDEKWEAELKAYNMTKKVALLQSVQDLKTYLEILSANADDYIVYFSSADEMTLGLSLDEKEILHNMGCNEDFNNSFACSFYGIYSNGEFSVCEKSYNDLHYCGEYDDREVELFSSGYYSSSTASIKIDGVEYAQKGRGINMVVYDKKTGMVVDSVTFDTNVQSDLRSYTRNIEQFRMLKEYEKAVCK